MTVFSGEVFDDSVAGSLTVWYTSAAHNDVLGSGDVLAVQATVQNLSGTSPSLTVQVEHSADGKDWIGAGSAIISTLVANNATYYGSRQAWPALLGFVRLKVSLGGSSPRCRLKLYACSREAMRSS